MDNNNSSNESQSTPGFVNLSDKNIKESDNIFESLSKLKEMTHVKSIFNKLS
jgi:hypothetical protein